MLAQVDALYADYGRGHDGMQLPWVTRCFRSVVRHPELPPEAPAPDGAAADRDVPRPGSRTTPTRRPGRRRAGRHRGHRPVVRRPPEDPGMQLIDFR